MSLRKGEVQGCDENARLKRLVADQALHIQVLKEVNGKKW